MALQRYARVHHIISLVPPIVQLGSLEIVKTQHYCNSRRNGRENFIYYVRIIGRHGIVWSGQEGQSDLETWVTGSRMGAGR